MSSYSSRVTAVISFYDEQVDQLIACVSSLAGVVDHVVAVDGAYALYPSGKASSDPAQIRVITEVCRGLRIGLTAHTPTQVWVGNEVEKRNHAMRLAEAVTSPDGWYLIHDADCVVTSVAHDWFERVAEIPKDLGAATVAVRETREIPGYHPDPEDTYSPVRLMYRALRRITYGPNHWTVHAPDPDTGEPIYFWGPAVVQPIDAYDASHLLKIDHRKERPEYRDINARKYYSLRERSGIERDTVLHTLHTDGTYRPISRS